MRFLVQLILIAVLTAMIAAVQSGGVAAVQSGVITPVQSGGDGVWVNSYSRFAGTADDDETKKTKKGSDIRISSCNDVAGICLRVGERDSMRPVWKPGKRTGRVVLCVWYRYGKAPGGWDDPDGTIALKSLVSGYLYVLACYYEGQGSFVPGYPRAVVYTSSNFIPGNAVNEREVAEYATNLLLFEYPRAALAPAMQQLVGVETWFAVTSRLNYPSKSAQAGDTWATVRAYFSHVDWDFGAYGRLRCTNDAAVKWNPKLSGGQQDSNCTRVFTRAPPSGGLMARVTIVWNIYWISSEYYGWRYHSTYSLSSGIPLNIVELQAVIR